MRREKRGRQSAEKPTFSGLDVVDGQFDPVQDHVLPLPALTSLPVPVDAQDEE